MRLAILLALSAVVLMLLAASAISFDHGTNPLAGILCLVGAMISTGALACLIPDDD